MKRCPFIAVVFLAGCADGPSLSDAERILGDWVVVDFHSPKATEDRSQLRKRAIISEGTWSEQFQGETFEDFEYTMNPNKSPQELDLIYTNADGKRLTIRAIYEVLDGDRLRVCFGSPPVVQKNGKVEYVESVRPVAFAAKDGPLISYHRKTK